jgi:hypothetical protein
MSDLNKITDAIIIAFRNKKGWEQFHKPEGLALAISIDAGELLKLFL